MSKTGNAKTAFCLALLVLVGAAASFVFIWQTEREALRRHKIVTAESLQAAKLIAEFRRLQGGERKAVEPSAQSRNPAAFFERLAKRFSVRPESIKGIETRTTAQADDSQYEELATVVRLVGVQQVQFGAFVRSIEKENPQYLIKQLRMTASEKGATLWDAQVTVSLLIYKPGSPEDL